MVYKIIVDPTASLDIIESMVHYFVDDEKNIIVVTSVLHTSRNPEIWDERNLK